MADLYFDPNYAKVYENIDMDVCLNEIRGDILKFRNREHS